MYVYDNIKDYMLLYPGVQDIIAENHLSTLMINDRTVVLVGDTHKGTSGYKPDLSKSLVYYDQGEDEFNKYVKRFDKTFEYITDVQYDPNKGEIIFSGQAIGRHFAVARKIGIEKYKGLTHIRGYILYDEIKQRLNLIMTPVKH